MRKLVFDTSAIFNFGIRGQLEHLIQRLVPEHHLLTTPEVDLEIIEPATRAFYKKFLSKYFTVQRPKNPKLTYQQLQHLSAMLGEGEVSVILLASELDATAVLDERAARAQAQQLKVDVTGTLGLLAYGIKRNWCTDRECIETIRRLHANNFNIRRPAANETFAGYLASFR